VRFGVGKRVDLFAGYSHVQDLGANPPRVPTALERTDFAIPGFGTAATFPLTYATPSARMSVKLHTRLRWNAGYQYYHYHEQFSALQNYRAHTGYSSLTWSF
jgi:hypothetical protein